MVSLHQVTLLYSDPDGQVSLYSRILEVLRNHKCSKNATKANRHNTECDQRNQMKLGV